MTCSSSHSIYQLLEHMIYWQEFVLAYFNYEDRAVPEHASESWVTEKQPSSEAQWLARLSIFEEGVKKAKAEASKDFNERFGGGRKTRLELLMMLTTHNSYHAGQVVLLRRQLKLWPPPSGGDTW